MEKEIDVEWLCQFYNNKENYEAELKKSGVEIRKNCSEKSEFIAGGKEFYLGESFPIVDRSLEEWEISDEKISKRAEILETYINNYSLSN